MIYFTVGAILDLLGPFVPSAAFPSLGYSSSPLFLLRSVAGRLISHRHRHRHPPPPQNEISPRVGVENQSSAASLVSYRQESSNFCLQPHGKKKEKTETVGVVLQRDQPETGRHTNTCTGSDAPGRPVKVEATVQHSRSLESHRTVQ